MFERDEVRFFVGGPDNLTQHQRFRYEIFGREYGWVDENECPGDIERDEFDPYSSHIFATHNGVIIGCCRLTFDNPVGGSYTEKFFVLPPPPATRDRIAEINRLALAKKWRGKEVSKFIQFGMFSLLYEECITHQIEYTYLTTHRPSYVHLRRQGVPVTAINGYDILPYDGYYSRCFDPSDTFPSIINVNSFGVFMKRNGHVWTNPALRVAAA